MIQQPSRQQRRKTEREVAKQMQKALVDQRQEILQEKEAEIERLMQMARQDEHTLISSWFYDVYLPSQRALEHSEQIVMQLISRLDEVIQMAKGSRRELIVKRIEGLTEDLGSQSVAYRNLMIKSDVLPAYIDAVTALVSAAQDAAALALDGQVDQAQVAITEAYTLRPQNPHPANSVNFGGRPAGLGPVQQFILDSVREVWSSGERSFVQSVHYFYTQLVERYQAKAAEDIERKALDKLNRVTDRVAYVEDLHKKHPTEHKIGGG